MTDIDPDKSDHRWGFKDAGFELVGDTVYFKGTRYPYLQNCPLPYFRGFIEETLDIKLSSDINTAKPITLPKSKLSKSFLTTVKKKFPAERFTISDRERLIHSHGQTTTDEVYKVLYQGGLKRYADGVFFPGSEEEVETLVALAVKNRICLVPYGGGTSVSSALLLPPQEKRPIISVDMRGLDQIEWINAENGTAMIQAGIVGRHLEEKLNQQGFTMGHEPDSMEFSTLGGWISTHASGMKRGRYGNIEDIVLNYTLITPQGRVEEVFPYSSKDKKTAQGKKSKAALSKTVPSSLLSPFDRVSAGMQAKKFFFGSEGNFGFITKALVKIHTLPEEKRYDSFMFPDFSHGIAFLKELSRTSYIPASIRLVDNKQFQFGYALRTKKTFIKGLVDRVKKWFLLSVKKFDPAKMCLATAVFEGERKDVDYRHQNVKALASRHGGMRAGSENGRRGYTLTMVIAYIRDFVSDHHSIGETLETTVPWDRVESLCQGMNEEMENCHREYRLPGKCFLSSRVTQLYHSGVCVYTTMALYMKGVKNPEEVFSQIEKRIRLRVLREGGSISHHHGIGKLRKDFHRDLITPAHRELLKQTKKTLDPQNILGVSNNIFGN